MLVKFYTRNKCHLCVNAKAILSELKSEFDFDLEEIDIDSDDKLTELYGIMIPVVVMDGEEVQYGQIEREYLVKRFQEKISFL